MSTALALLRPMGVLVLKSTVSLADRSQPQWAALANDIVVNEKVPRAHVCVHVCA